jgi:hypothetical protein
VSFLITFPSRELVEAIARGTGKAPKSVEEVLLSTLKCFAPYDKVIEVSSFKPATAT